MENIDPSIGLNRQFFQHFGGQQQAVLHDSYPHSQHHHHHPFYPSPHPGLQSDPSSNYTQLPSSCSFSPPVNFSSPASSDHVMAGNPYPTSNASALYVRNDSYSDSSSPNLNSSSGSVAGFQTLEHVAPYTPSPSESDSLDQTDSIDSCDPHSMTAVDLEDGEDGEGVPRIRRHHRRRRHSSTRSGSPVLQRQAANLRERRRMQSINEAFEVRITAVCVPSLVSYSKQQPH